MTQNERGARRNPIVAALALGIACLAGAPALAHVLHRDAGIGGGAFFGDPRTLRALDLTGAQWQAVRRVLQAHRPELQRLAAADKAARRAVEDALFDTGMAAPADVEGVLQTELDARSALERERIAATFAVRNELTPTQIHEVAAIRDGLDAMRTAKRDLAVKPAGPQ
jgi:Spy/CpxP family protein refolding chaperone